MPWTHIQLEQDGSYRPCCRTSGFRKKKKYFLKEYLESEELVNLKSDLLNGNLSPSCERCWNDEKLATNSNSYSLRLIENESFPTDASKHTKDTFEIKSMEIRTGNICNLSCRMCFSNYSSKWISEISQHETFLTDDVQLRESVGSVRQIFDLNNNSISELVKLARQCRHLLISGGEPFLSKGFIHFLNEISLCPEIQNMSIGLSTNATVYRKDIMNLLSKFRNADISISVDGTRKVNEYVRTNSNWDEIKSNLIEFGRDHSDQLSLTLAPTLNVWTIFYIDELLSFYEEELFPSFKLKNKFNFQVSPSWQAINILNLSERQKVLSKIESFESKCRIDSTGLKFFVLALKERLRQSDFDENGRRLFRRLSPIYDRIKNQSFEQFLPELSQELMS